ncbi:2-carboxy-1,4-naphthoquinone phytyltransferase, chloroplastic [Aristolochia californica]|uniref:2-carboxy-1,4-naphthoquinone phytyltransferase, chloroplastic n=1 Tax=Aristolochia californica TaxID=171875 RepID=UPI0035DF18D3
MALSIPSPFSLGLLCPPRIPSFVYSKSQRNLPTGYVPAHAFFSSGTRKWPRKEEHSLRSKASMENSAKDLKEANEISRAILIWRAVKLPIYSVALVPLTVGSAAAYLQSGGFLFGRYLLLLSSSILIILWLNLSNDVYDFDTGADQNKKESVVNLVGSRAVTHYAANLSLALGFMGLVWASAEAGDIQPFLLLISAVLCGYVYQCPPFRLSYKGLGEPLCFAAFGPFATTAFYMSQRTKSKLVHLPLNATVLSASLLVGLTTSLILFCSHFHQVEEDRAVGKMSPLVRLGTETASKLVKVAVVILYSLLVVLGLCRALPWTCIVLCALTFPIGKLVVDYVKEHHKEKGKIFMAKYYCVRLHTSFGAALAAGLAAARIVVKTKTVWGT